MSNQTVPRNATEILDWLGEQQTALSKVAAKLRGLFRRETDLDDKQERFKVLSECEGCLTKVKRMIAEVENEHLSLRPPDGELIGATERLADALEQELFKERRFSAHLKLFSDIAKGVSRLV